MAPELEAPVERNANYALVGFVTLALMIGLAVFAIWLGKATLAKENDNFDVVFVGSVSGLPEGGEVQFNGIKVGEVKRLTLDPTDPNKVFARIRVSSWVPVRTDSYATMEPLGITGVNFIQLTAGTATNPLLKTTVKPGVIPVIHTQSSVLQDLLKGGGTVLARAVETLDRVSSVLSKENVANFSGILEDLNLVVASARENSQVFQDADGAIKSLDQAAKDVSDLSNSAKELVNGKGAATLTNANSAIDELKAAATDIRSTVSALRGPTTDFATNTLPQVQSAISSLQSAADSLDRLANEIERDPRGLITKEPAQQIRVAP
ncbi:MAG: MlaD family protein [Alphaproteobacteria bacterium]